MLAGSKSPAIDYVAAASSPSTKRRIYQRYANWRKSKPRGGRHLDDHPSRRLPYRPSVLSVVLEDCHACTVQEDALGSAEHRLLGHGINLLVIRVTRPRMPHVDTP